jgi:Flp pilus assembly protein TadD
MDTIKELEERYQENPNDPEVCLQLGIEYGQKNIFNKSVPLLQKAVELDPDNPETHYNLAVCYGIMLLEDLERDELWEDITDEEELFELAISEYLEAIELDPEFVEAHNNLGTLYAMRGDEEDALKEWLISLEIDPDQPDIKEEVAIMQRSLREEEEYEE